MTVLSQQSFSKNKIFFKSLKKKLFISISAGRFAVCFIPPMQNNPLSNNAEKAWSELLSIKRIIQMPFKAPL
jgi:hypothetical protein